MSKKWGFLRETKKDAEKAGIDKKYNIGRTGLEDYLKVIFPNTKDWVHDKPTGIVIDNKKFQGRPDYKSEELKLIVEFDGLPHYKNPDIILGDEMKNIIYSEAGYKVVRIPYFIQLTNDVVNKIFDVKVQEPLFDGNIPSLSTKNRNTPAYLCPIGIRRMAIDFFNISLEQYNTNIKALLEEANNKEELEFLTGINAIEREMEILFTKNASI